MIQNLFRYKIFISLFSLSGLTSRLCGGQSFFLFVAFIILVLSPPVLFAEENIEKKGIPVVTQTNNEEGNCFMFISFCVLCGFVVSHYFISEQVLYHL